MNRKGVERYILWTIVLLILLIVVLALYYSAAYGLIDKFVKR